MVEYRLKGNEFKLLQYLKTIDHAISINDLVRALYISDRGIKDNLKTLIEYNVLSVSTVKGVNKYTINNVDTWNFDVYTHKNLRADINKLCLEEELKNGNIER